MEISRRDFIKMFGVTVASLSLTRCKFFPLSTPTPTLTPIPTPIPTPTPRAALKSCWTGFAELARVIREAGDAYEDVELEDQMLADHRRALDELVAGGEIGEAVAALVHEAFNAAVNHIWYSNIPVTCYEPMMVDYEPTSANILVQQAELLGGYAQQGVIDPETLAVAQAALEHDMAYIALSHAETDDLVKQIMEECQDNWECIPEFEALALEPSADARAAAQFIVELLTEK